jgi:hypothetical protein
MSAIAFVNINKEDESPNIESGETDNTMKIQSPQEKDDDASIYREDTGIPGTNRSALLMLLFWLVCIFIKGTIRFKGSGNAFKWANVECDGFEYKEICIQHSIMYRIAAVVVSLFLLQMFATLKSIDNFDYGWIYKIVYVCAGSFCLLYFNFDEFDDALFTWISRIGAFLFIILQSLIFLDFAYFFNEGLLEKAGLGTVGRIGDRTVKAVGKCAGMFGNFYLTALITIAIFNFGAFLTAIGFLYSYFSPPGAICNDNSNIITVTLILMIIAAYLQLTGNNGSLITTSILAIYVAYLTFAALSLNPNGACNASMGTGGSSFGIGPSVIGIIYLIYLFIYLFIYIYIYLSIYLSFIFQ